MSTKLKKQGGWHEPSNTSISDNTVYYYHHKKRQLRKKHRLN